MAASAVIALTAEAFRPAVLSSADVWVVEFGAAWCGACVQMRAALEEVARRSPGVRMGTVDVGASPSVARSQDVRSVPTTIIYRGGHEVVRLFGAKNERQLLKAIAEATA